MVCLLSAIDRKEKGELVVWCTMGKRRVRHRVVCQCGVLYATDAKAISKKGPKRLPQPAVIGSAVMHGVGVVVGRDETECGQRHQDLACVELETVLGG